MCTAVLTGKDAKETHQPPISPRIWAHTRGRYWSTKIDDFSLCPSWFTGSVSVLEFGNQIKTRIAFANFGSLLSMIIKFKIKRVLESVLLNKKNKT